MKETRKVGRNIFSVLLGQLTGVVISFLYLTLIPRQLGPERLGQFSYWISWAFVLSAILDFGTGFYNRYIPEFKVKEPGKVKALIRESLKIDGLILLALILIVPHWLKLSFWELAAVFIGAILTAIVSIFTQVFYSYEKLGYSSFIRIVIRLLRMALILYIIKTGVRSLLWAVFLPELAAILFYTFPFGKVLPRETAFLPEGVRRYISFGFYAYLATVCLMTIGRASVILAKEMIGDLKIVGYTSIAVEISVYTLRIMAISIFFGALPSGLRYLASNDNNRLDRFLELSWRYGNMIIFPFAFGFLIVGHRLIELFIGEKYLGGLSLMFAFLPSAIILFWLQAHHHILVIYEKKAALFYSSLISAVGLIGLAMIMVVKIGAYALPLALGVGLFIGYIYAYRQTSSFKSIRNYLPSIVKPIVSGLIMLAIIWAFTKVLNTSLIFLILVGVISYISTMVLLKGISKEDYLKIRAIIFS